MVSLLAGRNECFDGQCANLMQLVSPQDSQLASAGHTCNAGICDFCTPLHAEDLQPETRTFL